MHPRTRTIQTLAFVSILSIGMVGAYVWFFMHILGIGEDINMLASTIGTRAGEEERLRSAEHILETTKEERQTIERYFVTEESIVLFIEELEQLGEDAGVSVTIATVGAEEGQADSLVGEVSIRFASVGTWQNTAHFITLIDALPYAFEMQLANLERAKEATDEWKGSFALSVGMIK